MGYLDFLTKNNTTTPATATPSLNLNAVKMPLPTTTAIATQTPPMSPTSALSLGFPMGNSGSTPATSTPAMNMSPLGAGFTPQAIPQIKAQATAPAPVMSPAPTNGATPAAPVPMGATPVSPAMPSGTPQGASSTPTAPDVSPEALNAQNLATKAYEQSLKLSPAELSTQEDLDKIIESTKKAYVNTEDQAIPMEFITGQMASIERRANALAEPLDRKLARLQAARTASLESSKFALDRADKVVSDQKTTAATARKDAESTRQFNVQQGLAEKKFTEDTRQFGLKYAQDERKIAQEAALVREKLNADKTPAGQVQSNALNNYSLVSDLLNLDPSSITGVGQNPLNFFGVTNQEAINKYDQLKGVLSLENRQKLKGSGAISDFESKTLSQAATSLGRNLPNDAFKKELNHIKGVFANAAGLPANVKVTDNKSGQTKSGTLSRVDINSAISQGYSIEYQ